MYKITKTINECETIVLVFDDVKTAKEVFNDLQYDEYIRFANLYESGINRETINRTIDHNVVYKEYKISIPTFSVTIILTYIKD